MKDTKTNSLPCPSCQSPITYSTQGLLEGMSFECQSCHSVIKLQDSAMDTVKNAMEEFEKLKSHKL